MIKFITLTAGLLLAMPAFAFDVADIAAQNGFTPDNQSHVSFTYKGSGPYRRDPNPPLLSTQFKITNERSIYDKPRPSDYGTSIKP